MNRYRVVSLGSQLIAAPAGTLTTHRWRWRAKRHMWSFKWQTPYMEFAVIDSFTATPIAATCSLDLLRSHS